MKVIYEIIRRNNNTIMIWLEFAHHIRKKVGGESKIVNEKAVQDDPQRRRPNITLAKNKIGWQPKVRGLVHLVAGRLKATNGHTAYCLTDPTDSSAENPYQIGVLCRGAYI